VETPHQASALARYGFTVVGSSGGHSSLSPSLSCRVRNQPCCIADAERAMPDERLPKRSFVAVDRRLQQPSHGAFRGVPLAKSRPWSRPPRRMNPPVPLLPFPPTEAERPTSPASPSPPSARSSRRPPSRAVSPYSTQDNPAGGQLEHHKLCYVPLPAADDPDFDTPSALTESAPGGRDRRGGRNCLLRV
jgi:hypothetical protein